MFFNCRFGSETSTRPMKRYIYVDMGANWANTLDFYKTTSHFNNVSNWEIYAFEASPLIQPFLENYTLWKNGNGEKPELKFPNSGSSNDLKNFGARYGCNVQNDMDEFRECMLKKVESELCKLIPNASLGDINLINNRLNEARYRNDKQLPRYVILCK